MAGVFINPHRYPALVSLGHRLEAALLGLIWAVSARLSAPRASRWGRRLFTWIGPYSRKQRWVMANLQLALPSHDPPSLQTLSRQVWGHFGAWLWEYPHLAWIAEQGLEIVHPDGDANWMTQGGPWVFIAAHLANIELTGLACKALGITADAVYSPLANPYLDAHLQRFREIHGNRFIPKQNALRSLLRSLRAGRSVGLVVDVRTDEGSLSPFFGALAPTTEVPAWLALKFACPMVPMAVERVGDARFRVLFYPPLTLPEEDNESQAVAALTVAMNRAVEITIQANPGQWWCGKRRWPRSAYSRA